MTKHTAFPPALYIVATPIGNLGDITMRALETLRNVDVIACEDTRVSIKLLQHYGISKKLIPYHEHNGEAMRPKILSMLREGQSVALISDAGTPLISDPGYKLVRAVVEAGLPLTSLPGPSSIIMALTLAGLPTDHFLFAGFVNTKDFDTLASIPYTLIFLSTPHKLLKDLKAMEAPFKGREVVVARELTKMFEEVQRGSFEEVTAHYTAHPPKGEIVLLLSPPTAECSVDLGSLDEDIRTFKEKHSVKELSDILAQKYKMKKRDVYQRILEIG